ncbi:MAG: YihY/virulence factor BrkB family protein, partial [Acidobacteria bacterium]|nr:YihY/virulence factor BrkB family protein [Acidobacteriota bacterium]
TALGGIYYFAPNVRRPLVWIAPGAVAATLLWILASLGFSWYASHVGEYQKTYGAIGGVIVALLWLYASGLAILVGAELNAAIEQTVAERPVQAPRDRTTAFRAGRPHRLRRVR